MTGHFGCQEPGSIILKTFHSSHCLSVLAGSSMLMFGNSILLRSIGKSYLKLVFVTILVRILLIWKRAASRFHTACCLSPIVSSQITLKTAIAIVKHQYFDTSRWMFYVANILHFARC